MSHCKNTSMSDGQTINLIARGSWCKLDGNPDFCSFHNYQIFNVRPAFKVKPDPMTSKANFVLFLTLMTMTLTLVRSCLLQRGFVCVPEQQQCLRVGGRCSIVDGRCQCVPAYAFYGHNTRYAYHQAQQEYEPPSNQVEYNAEYHANMMAGAATMYRIMT